MKQQHHPIDLKTYEKGINSDVNKEILGGSTDGSHVDALNMRSISMDGDNFAKKKIKGESLLYDAIDNRCFLETPGVISSDYECMLTLEIGDHIIEIWASSKEGEDPFMRVDGQIVLMSPDFPIDLNHPLQYHKNENCVSGEFYVTNFNTKPMVFSLKDLMENSGMLPGSECTLKYFDNFNIDEYVIQVSGTLFKPAFIKQVAGASPSAYGAVFGNSGLAVGSYSYSYRYVSQQGDRTPFSPFTELIPVVRNSSENHSPYFPNNRTYSSEPDITNFTSYGNHIRIKYLNDLNFSFIEVRRDSWYAGDPIDLPPVSEIIGSFPMNEGLNVIDILDRADPSFEDLEILDLGEQTSQGAGIKKAKSIRYFNERLYLMNIEYNSRDLSEGVTFVDELDPIFPTIHKLGKEGHKHVYNAAMYKSNMRGEKTGYAVVLHDKPNNASYAIQVPNATNFQFPNRRDEVSAETLGTSYLGTVYAANTDGAITETHEVFDHYDTIRRSEFDDAGFTNFLIGFKENDPYATLEPTSQTDTNSDFKYLVNHSVGLDGTPNIDYNPKAFGLDYYAMGAAFKGLASVPEEWNEGFSIVQTEPARRVVAQGLGFYQLVESEGIFSTDTAKGVNSFWAYFPDLELLFPDVYEDFINNPTSFKIQLVSPLGYHTDVYTHYNDLLDSRDKGADLLTRAMILRDGTDFSQIPVMADFNPGISGNGNSGINEVVGSTNYDYVAFGRYTNYITQDSPAFPSNGNGNAIFEVIDASNATTYSGRQGYIRVEIQEEGTGNFHYNTPGMNSQPATLLNANDDGVMEWREPMYVINLIRDVDVAQGNTTQYKYSSAYYKFKSMILESDGDLNQSATLVSERWEDCIPRYSGQINNDYSGLYRFIYVVDENGVERRWLNVTFETAGFISTLLTNMGLNGFDTVTDASGSYDVYGIYTSSQTSDNLCPIFTINFNNVPGSTAFTVPASGTKVYVYYDNRIPVRVFGGDTYINESVWAVMDNEWNNNGEPVNDESQFRMNAPFPFKSYEYADGYRAWINSDLLGGHNYSGFVGNDRDFTFNVNAIQSSEIRQIVTMWTAETRINLSFAFNNESPDKANSDQFYPLINYIPRPHKWKAGNETDRTAFENNNHLNPLYFDDYGYEWNLWPFGGFRFTPQTNLDYSKSQTTVLYTSVPLVGFEEQTKFCTRIVWSERRPINVQNTPTVKTFPGSNYFDISDDTGEIKFAWSALSQDKGNNLYSITDSGICLLLIDKRIIHEINADELATVGSDIGGILNQLWIDRNIGMADETWRSWAEYSNYLFFTNKISEFLFTDNSIIDLGKTGFYELWSRKVLPLIGEGYAGKMCGGYNVLTNEYIVDVARRIPPENIRNHSALIYGVDQQALQCQSTYDYDKYLYVQKRLYGMKNSKTYELGVGNQINGKDMECYVAGVSDKEIYFDKEFIRIRVNSKSKPSKIFFYDNYDDYRNDAFSSVVDASSSPIAIKNYFGYECYIPRKDLAPHYRQQGRLCIFKIVSEADEEFFVTSTGVQYKALK